MADGLWDKIDAIRTFYALPLTTMEARAGLPKDALRRIKRGLTMRPSAELINALAAAFRLEPGWLTDPHVNAEDILARLAGSERVGRMVRDDFALRLATLRIAQKQTPPAFAEALGLDPDAYLELEVAMRDPTLVEVRALCRAFPAVAVALFVGEPEATELQVVAP